jgi:hypothetical protein
MSPIERIGLAALYLLGGIYIGISYAFAAVVIAVFYIVVYIIVPPCLLIVIVIRQVISLVRKNSQTLSQRKAMS